MKGEAVDIEDNLINDLVDKTKDKEWDCVSEAIKVIEGGLINRVDNIHRDIVAQSFINKKNRFRKALRT